MLFEVDLPPLQDEAENETITRTPQCLYWDVDKGEWSGEGCEMTFYNGTHMECTCDHLTDFGTAFTDTAQSLNFDVFTNFAVWDDLAQKLIDNPAAFAMLFAMYFLCGVVCVGGSIQDGRDPQYMIYRKNLNEFESFNEAQLNLPQTKNVRLLRAVFAMVILALAALTVACIGICIVSWTSDSPFSIVSRTAGPGVLLAYAIFQGLAVAMGLQIGGFWRSPGNQMNFFIVFIVINVFNVGINSFAIDFATSFSGGGIGWAEAEWFMELMWKSLSVNEQDKLQRKLNCCGFSETYDPGDVETAECPDHIDSESGSSTEFCYTALNDNISGTVLVMAVLQLICVLLVVPLGILVYIIWQGIRMKQQVMDEFANQDRFVNLLGKPPLDPPKKEIGDKKEVRKEKEATKSWLDRLKANLYVIWDELRENHHILEIYLSTKVDFPRRDRSITFLAYTLTMFLVSGLAYDITWEGSCCVDDENYGEQRFVVIGNENVSQTCEWWWSQRVAENKTDNELFSCADVSFASDFTGKDVSDLRDACPASCGGCDLLQNVEPMCRYSLMLINFLLALIPSFLAAVSFTNVYRIDRLNDERWDAVVPNIVAIRTQVKALRGHYRRFTQLGTWNKAELIVDLLVSVEDWSKAATVALLSPDSHADERETSLLWLNYIRGHLDQLVAAIERGHLNAAAEQMVYILEFEKAKVQSAVKEATTAFLTGGGGISGGAMGKLKGKAKEAKKEALKQDVLGAGEQGTEGGGDSASEAGGLTVDTFAKAPEEENRAGWVSNLMKKGKMYITGSDDKSSPDSGRPKTPLGRMFGRGSPSPEHTNWSTSQEKESAEALEKITKYFEAGTQQRIRRKMRAKWGIRIAYTMSFLQIFLCTWFIMTFALQLITEDPVEGADATNDWLVTTLETWTITFFLFEPGTIIMKAMLLGVILKKLEGTRIAVVVGTFVELVGAAMGGGADNIAGSGGDILAAGGAGEIDEDKAMTRSASQKAQSSRDVDDLVMAVFSGRHKKLKLADGKKKEKKSGAGLNLLTGKKYQVHVGGDDDEDGKEEEKTDEPAMHFDPKAEAQVATLTPRGDKKASPSDTVTKASPTAAKEPKATGPPATMFAEGKNISSTAGKAKPKGPPANLFGAGAVDAVTGAPAPAGPSVLDQLEQQTAPPKEGVANPLTGPPKPKSPPVSVLSESSAEAKAPASRGPPARLMAAAAPSAEGKPPASKGPPANLMQAKGPPAGLMKMSGAAGAKPSSSTTAPKMKGPSVNLMKSAMAKKQASPDSAVQTDKK